MAEETKDIVVRQEMAIESFPIGGEKDNLLEWMKLIAEAPFYKKMGGLPAMMSIVLTGRELGCGPMASLNGGFWDIQGRISMSSEMMRSKFRQAGHSLTLVILTDQICTLKGVLKNNKDACEMSFTIGDAALAGLVNKDNWKKHPKDMLLASCARKVIRFLAPELLAGTGVDEIETIDITPVNVEKKEKMTEQSLLFIDRFSLIDLSSAASKFVDSISTNLGQDRKSTIIQCAKEPDKFEKNLARFVEKISANKTAAAK